MHATATVVFLLTGLIGPQPDEELLPAPRAMPRPAPSISHQPLPPLGFYRPNPYDVWQRYSVGDGGFWRTRVLNTPEGAFYLYNGEPYYWTTVKTRNHKVE
jgi:hypothetical protein